MPNESISLGNLIKAMQIFNKYGNPEWPICPDHDILRIHPDFTPEIISQEDKVELEKLHFDWSDEDQSYYTHAYCN